MYSRLRSFTIRSKSVSKSPKNKLYKARDASMHSRSSSRGSKSDIDVDQPPKYFVNYATIDERKSEESDDSKNINLSSISKPQSLLSIKALLNILHFYKKRVLNRKKNA